MIGRNDREAATAVRVAINDDGTWTYHEITMLQMAELKEPFAHTDHNTLAKVG